MTYNTVRSTPLFTCYHTDVSDNRVTVCQILSQKTTALVLLLISLSFIATGLYLILAGTGTIASFSIGCVGLTVGCGTLVLGGFLSFKADCSQKTFMN